ncbi:hypothetical protein AG1IA_07415 [Rhizoctonia solani AG-1 IA]|uniref:Uncharacterized protein n=1 Tax=Thanatephorus cucumeris (strain AG1-IA) TaxID=983506 RepID=L8WP62_THACA|nr:hypothetical protein AG1IA_07415 [Rhizoctonia solani AG-1 IA]
MWIRLDEIGNTIVDPTCYAYFLETPVFVRHKERCLPVSSAKLCHPTAWHRTVPLLNSSRILVADCRILGFVTCLLLPLQWGGNTKPWKDKVVIALFCLFAVIFIAFLLWEKRKGSKGILPLSLFRHRTQIGTCIEAFMIYMAMILATYYLPLQSGIDILPFMLACVSKNITFISEGTTDLAGKLPRARVPLVSAVASGLLFGLNDVDISSARLAGFQILLGVGLGGSLQNVIIAIQAEYNHDEKMIPQATVRGIIGIAVAGAVFANKLASSLFDIAPNFPPEVAEGVRQSVTIIYTLPPDQQGVVIQAYVRALNYVYLVGVPVVSEQTIKAAIYELNDLCWNRSV